MLRQCDVTCNVTSLIRRTAAMFYDWVFPKVVFNRIMVSCFSCLGK